MHSQHFTERSFLEIKQQLGLNEYQVRGIMDGTAHVYVYDGATIHSNRKDGVLQYFNINEVPSTTQLAELIRILLPQKNKNDHRCAHRIFKP